MGNKNIKEKDSILVDRLILECFKDTDLEVPITEINRLKYHFKDAEKYFNFKFDYLVYFNNKLFHDGLPALYDNYISKVEQFSFKFKSLKKIFSIFIDFEQNYEFDEENDLEFDPIFTVVFEKLEIKNILCFYLVSCELDYLQIFFEQLYENVYLYKDSRNYDSLYFLLPNKDYFIKNEDYLLYLCSIGKSSDKIENYYMNSFKTIYNDIIFNTNYFNKFLGLKSSPNYSSSKINTFLKNFPDILFIKYISEIDLDDKDKLNFINQQKRFFDFHNLLCTKTANMQIIFIIKNSINNDNIHNLTNLIKFIITNFQNSNNTYSLLVIKIINYGNNNNNNINNIEKKEEIKEKDNNYFIILDKFIQMILNLSFMKGNNKNRKLIIDYYNIFNITKSNASIKNSKQKIEIFAKNKNEEFINNLDEEGIEDSEIKKNTFFLYNKEKLSYEWFIRDNYLKKLKINIIYFLDINLNLYNAISNSLNKKKKSSYLNKEKFIKIKKNIFSYIFPSNLNKYFYSQYNKHINLKNNEDNFEKLIFV